MKSVQTASFLCLTLTAAFAAGEPKVKTKRVLKPSTAEAILAVETAPKSFFLDFTDAYLVYTPSSKNLHQSE